MRADAIQFSAELSKCKEYGSYILLTDMVINIEAVIVIFCVTLLVFPAINDIVRGRMA